MSACVPVLRGLRHLLVGGTVRGCVVGPVLLPRPATPGWGVGACAYLCVRPACTALFLGVCGCCCWWGLPPPSPLVFFWGGVLCGVGRWLPRSWVSWSLFPDSSSSGPRCLLFVFFSSVVCVRVFWVSLLPVGRCPRLFVAGFGWVVPRRPFGGSRLRCSLGGWVGRLLWCWWVVWWLWAVLAPPPWFFLGGGLPVPPSAFPGLAHALVGILCGFPFCCWWLRFARLRPVPLGRLGYVHVGLGAPSCRVRSGSAGWAAAPGGCVRTWVSRVLSSPRCRL